MSLVESIGRLLRPSARTAKNSGDVPRETLRRFPFIQERLDRWVIDKRYCEDIRNNTDFARSLGEDPQDLAWFFRIVIREDPRTWRSRLRVREAMNLFRKDADSPVTAIAEAVGFSDSANFARQFRRETGMSPTRWREKNYGSRTTSL